MFHVNEDLTEGRLLYDLGNKQWNIPEFLDRMEHLIEDNAGFREYQVSHPFPEIGSKIMLLNARRIVQKSTSDQLVLLAIHDVTEERLKAMALESINKNLQ